MLSQELYSISKSVFRAARIRSLAFSWATSALSTVLDILSVLSTGEWGIGLKNLLPYGLLFYT